MLGFSSGGFEGAARFNLVKGTRARLSWSLLIFSKRKENPRFRKHFEKDRERLLSIEIERKRFFTTQKISESERRTRNLLRCHRRTRLQVVGL
ncbi:hypothetical protein MKW98_001668 [Papaver atlanticum]|uniref:Uncharacterized protein n=1 Tax=Papaver atlanticum TaxID=357466 RepID=A0AAD4S6X1_9MAGN|nr:hypothetical protein MKW98_001668 [Papaver atlanticum]